MRDTDTLHRFLFEDLGLRGELVYLDSSWQAVLERHPYPPIVREQLGQALAAAALLSATLKFDGNLILQLQGQGPLRTVVAQATSQRTLRGLARWDQPLPNRSELSALYGEGYLVLTLQSGQREPFQGVVGLEGDHLADTVAAYFNQSEQVPTRLWLHANAECAVGLLIQQLPRNDEDAEQRAEDWRRVTLLADTVTAAEMLQLPAQTLLHRLFNEENLRLLQSEPLSFRCGCSRERIEDMLRALGRDEIDSILHDHGRLAVQCEFCNHEYEFDPVDVEGLLRNDLSVSAPATRH